MIALMIVLLILLGIFLLLLEFFVVPGITVAGIGGVLMIGGGIYLAYHTYGTGIGHLILILTMLFCVLTLVAALKSRTWKKLMLDTTVEGKVEKFEEDTIKAEDEGMALTRLAPMGKISINNIVVEAKSEGSFIDEKTPIIVVRVINKTVIVKPKNSN